MTMQFTVKNNSNRLRVIPYIGNKSGFVDAFDKLIPDHFSSLKFYDIFGGSSSFSLYICNRFGSKRVVYNDNNPTVVNLIRYVKTNPRGLIDEYKKHQSKASSEYYYYVRELDLNDGLIGAGRFFYLAKNAFSGKIRFNPRGKFNCPIRLGSKCPRVDEDSLLYISSIIQDLEITNKSFESFSDVKGIFVYLDPPYLNNPNGHYNQTINPNDFIRFVKEVETSNKVMISEQNDPKFLKLSPEFYVYSIFLQRSLQYFTKERSREIIAVNYRIP